MQQFNTYLLVGPPGSGKGTQGKALGALPQFFHLACGDIFRSIDAASPQGRAFKQYSSKGQLVPDDLTVDLWLSRIKAHLADGSFSPETMYLLLDGIPRNIAQAKRLESYVKVKKVFHLNCSQAALFQRLKRRALKEKRLDDASESVIRRRIETYERESKPLLEYYSPGQLCEIDADRLAHQVLHNILSGLIRTKPWRVRLKWKSNLPR